MAGKKIPSIQDSVETFKDVMKRCSLQNYVYVDTTLISKNQKDQSIIMVMEHPLWNKLTEDNEFMKNVTEMDINSSDRNLLKYSENLDVGWLEVDPQTIFNGLTFKITVKGFVYELLINKNMIPLKLKKAEVNNIQYKIFSDPYVLAIRKKFVSPVDGGSFTIMRLMQIL